MKQIVYISNSKSKNISVWKLNKHGKLNLLQKIKTPGICKTITINRKKKILYVGISPNYSIINYSINKNGFLEQKKITKIPICPVYISLYEDKNLFFCSSYHSNMLKVYNMNKKGILKKNIQTIYNLKKCHCSILELKKKILWISCLENDCIKHFYLNNFKKLVFMPHIKINSNIGSGPRHIIFNSSGKYAYIINELSSSIDVIKIYKKNFLKKVQTINILKKNFYKKKWAADIHITSNNKWIYCSERTTNSITQFKVSKNGSFLEKKNFYKCEKHPRSFLIDKTNKFILIIGRDSNHVRIMSINNNNGSLKHVSRYYTGKSPLWISSMII